MSVLVKLYARLRFFVHEMCLNDRRLHQEHIRGVWIRCVGRNGGSADLSTLIPCGATSAQSEWPSHLLGVFGGCGRTNSQRTKKTMHMQSLQRMEEEADTV